MSQVNDSKQRHDDSSNDDVSVVYRPTPSAHSSPSSSSSLSERSRSTTDIPSELLDSSNSTKTEQELNLVGKKQNTVHGHTLPSGWSCKYNLKTDEYKFEFDTVSGGRREQVAQTSRDKAVTAVTPTMDHTVQTSRRPTFDAFECQYGYHFPASPTSSMISDLAKQVQKSSATVATKAPSKQIGYGKSKLTLPSDEDLQLQRLKNMFPTATVPVIEQMIRIYHRREGLIKAALISLGYKRATDYDAQQSISQSPIMLMMSKPSSKKLFEKLVSYFPDKDETLIKNLMYKFKEVEHEIISTLVESGQEAHIGKSLTEAKVERNGAIMKLRYLKCLYPTCEEIELYHILHCNDLNAQKVMEEVERKGHKRANIEEVMQNRKSQTQQMRAQQISHAAAQSKASAPTDLLDAHLKRAKPIVPDTRAEILKQNLKKVFEQHEDGLLMAALVSADYNEALAKKFLEEMEPIDNEKYKQRYTIELEPKADVVAFPCKAIQKGDVGFMSILANEYVYIPREVIECKTAVALIKKDAATFTEEDFPVVRQTRRQGVQPNLASGPNTVRVPRIKLASKKILRLGSNYEQITNDENRPKPRQKAHGKNPLLANGRNKLLNIGHNAMLLQRTHPFFK